jgi:hypothetical protein
MWQYICITFYNVKQPQLLMIFFQPFAIKQLSLSITLCLVLLSFNSYAENDKASLVIALSSGVTTIPSFGFQRQLSPSTAITFEYGQATDIEEGFGYLGTAVGSSYKSYTGNYRDSGFYRIGLALFNRDEAEQVTLPILTMGYESFISKKTILGAELGVGTTAGLHNFSLSIAFLY